MNALHIRELTWVEVRRSAYLLRRLYLLGVVALAVFFFIGRATDENILAIVMGVTLGAASVTPFAVMRDEFGRLAALAPFQLALGFLDAAHGCGMGPYSGRH
ncbi:MAG: hypothetical protein OXF01_10790 [Gemmatimonadetes bacterium]|nr:hypothetical protein [Gemmatimonadota bacterium]